MKPHGTRTRYQSPCRCERCRAANTAYENLRSQSERDYLVPSNAARKHLRKLRKSGVGYRGAAISAGLSRAGVLKILTGKFRIRVSTERKVLAVTKDGLSDGAFVNSELTKARIAELLEEGFTKRRMAREMGIKGVFQIARGAHVRAKTQMKVEKLHRRYMAA